MKSISQLFNYLNDINFQYVVLRNWGNLPDSVEFGDHSDLDLLVYDIEHFKEVITDARQEYPYPRVRMKIPIGTEYIFSDIRHLGDGYYPVDFEKAMLDTRVWNEKGFWTPDPLHHAIGLAYHAVHHKNENTYQRWLGDATIKELLEALKQSNIGWVPPTDRSVGSFNQYWKGATSVIDKKEDSVIKTQTSFKGYDLIANEKRILSVISSVHFPKLINATDGTIEVENCGESLSVDNAPKDWKEQLVQILVDLKSNNVQHRDIKPDNLMVKDGVIKLIDFGWARFFDDKPDSPPSCLGFPYRCSEGFDDAFSMRKVIKEMDYKFEEKEEEIFA
jgi:hypothetical protein